MENELLGDWRGPNANTALSHYNLPRAAGIERISVAPCCTGSWQGRLGRLEGMERMERGHVVVSTP